LLYDQLHYAEDGYVSSCCTIHADIKRRRLSNELLDNDAQSTTGRQSTSRQTTSPSDLLQNVVFDLYDFTGRAVRRLRCLLALSIDFFSVRWLCKHLRQQSSISVILSSFSSLDLLILQLQVARNDTGQKLIDAPQCVEDVLTFDLTSDFV